MQIVFSVENIAKSVENLKLFIYHRDDGTFIHPISTFISFCWNFVSRIWNAFSEIHSFGIHLFGIHLYWINAKIVYLHFIKFGTQIQIYESSQV